MQMVAMGVEDNVGPCTIIEPGESGLNGFPGGDGVSVVSEHGGHGFDIAHPILQCGATLDN